MVEKYSKTNANGRQMGKKRKSHSHRLLRPFFDSAKKLYPLKISDSLKKDRNVP